MKKQNTNLLVGAKVILDYPNRWRGAKDAKTREALRAETEASKASGELRGAYYFGETGIVTNYTGNTDSGNDYDVLLDSSRTLVSVHGCEMTVIELPKEQDFQVMVVHLLTALLANSDYVEGEPLTELTLKRAHAWLSVN